MRKLIATWIIGLVLLHIPVYAYEEKATNDDTGQPEMDFSHRSESVGDDSASVDGGHLRVRRQNNTYDRSKCFKGDLIFTPNIADVPTEMKTHLRNNEKSDCLEGNFVVLGTDSIDINADADIATQLKKFIRDDLKFIFGAVRIDSAIVMPGSSLEMLEVIEAREGVALDIQRTRGLSLSKLERISTGSCSESVFVDELTHRQSLSIRRDVNRAVKENECRPTTTPTTTTKLPAANMSSEASRRMMFSSSSMSPLLAASGDVEDNVDIWPMVSLVLGGIAIFFISASIIMFLLTKKELRRNEIAKDELARMRTGTLYKHNRGVTPSEEEIAKWFEVYRKNKPIKSKLEELNIPADATREDVAVFSMYHERGLMTIYMFKIISKILAICIHAWSADKGQVDGWSREVKKINKMMRDSAVLSKAYKPMEKEINEMTIRDMISMEFFYETRSCENEVIKRAKSALKFYGMKLVYEPFVAMPVEKTKTKTNLKTNLKTKTNPKTNPKTKTKTKKKTKTNPKTKTKTKKKTKTEKKEKSETKEQLVQQLLVEMNKRTFQRLRFKEEREHEENMAKIGNAAGASPVGEIGKKVDVLPKEGPAPPKEGPAPPKEEPAPPKGGPAPPKVESAHPKEEAEPPKADGNK